MKKRILRVTEISAGREFLRSGMICMLVCCIAVVLCSCSKTSKDRKIVLKAGHALSSTHPMHLALEHMAKLLKEKSKGNIELKIYPSSQLGNTRVMLEQTQQGMLAMVPASTAYLEGFQPDFGVFSVPYIFRDREHYWKVLDGKIGGDLLKGCDSIGLKGLCYFDAGARSFYMRKTMIKTPDDLAGKKVRVMDNQTCIKMVEALGGSPQPIPFGELYTSLQQGLVDGAENNPPSFISSRHCEICKFYSLDEHARIPDILLFSKKKWDSLPKDIQKIILEAAKETSQFQRELWAKKTKEDIETLKTKFKVEIYTPDKAPFRKKVEAMHESYKGTPIGNLIEKIKETK